MGWLFHGILHLGRRRGGGARRGCDRGSISSGSSQASRTGCTPASPVAPSP